MSVINIKTYNGHTELDTEWRAKERIRHTYGSAMSAIEEHIEGDFADFGIAQGTSTIVMAHALADGARIYPQRHAARPRKIAVFDSFKGYPQPSEMPDIGDPRADIYKRSHDHWPSAELIFHKLSGIYDKNLIVMGVGWFDETVKQIPPNHKFAFINLDGTLYSSNRTVLRHFFINNHFSDGCHVHIGGFSGSKKFGARRAWLECVEEFKPDFTDMGFFGASHWHCIIHNASTMSPEETSRPTSP